MAYLFGPLSITGSSVIVSGSVTNIPASGSTSTSTGPFNTSGSLTQLTGSLTTSGSSTTIGIQTITGSLIVSGANSTIVVPTYTTGSQPSLPLTGSMYFDYQGNRLYIYDGTTWRSTLLS